MLSSLEVGVFFVFFASHVPITLLVDGQAVLPAAWYPTSLRDLVAWYGSADGFNDPLMRNLPTWFSHIVLGEVFLQLPFFFFAVAALLARSNALRTPGLLYGAHVCTTMIPILGHFAVDPDLDDESRRKLIALYLPYLLVPAWFVFALLRGEPFTTATVKPSDRRGKRD